MSSTTLNPALLLQRLQAVAEETRLHLVQMLAGGERCVCELQDDLGGAAQSRLSFHLRKLKEAGVVSDRREGRWVYYTLVPGALDEMRDFLGEVAAGRALTASGHPLPTSRPDLVPTDPDVLTFRRDPVTSRGAGWRTVADAVPRSPEG